MYPRSGSAAGGCVSPRRAGSAAPGVGEPGPRVHLAVCLRRSFFDLARQTRPRDRWIEARAKAVQNPGQKCPTALNVCPKAPDTGAMTKAQRILRELI